MNAPTYHPSPVTRHSRAIEKIEAWARWEQGSDPDKLPGKGEPKSPGYIPNDQADYLTVELALKSFAACRPGADPHGLRLLLLHVYGCDELPEQFDPLLLMKEQDSRAKVRAFLSAFGWRPSGFARTTVRKFVAYLSDQLAKSR